MGVNSLPKTVTRQRRGCDLKPGPSAPESSTITKEIVPNDRSCDVEARLPSSVVILGMALAKAIRICFLLYP